MIIIPAVDLLDGKAVRLHQGDPNRQTVFSHDPVEVARRWSSQGAERLHVVDLDGSWAGAPRNRGLVQQIVEAIPIPVQLGGGIRDLEVAGAYLEAGVERVILGTMAVERTDLLAEACRRWPGRVAAAIDARAGRVAIRGWKDATDLQAVDLARRVQEAGVAVIIYTDVERDGMGGGVNIQATRDVARSVAVPVIASGGVATMEDLSALLEVAHHGIEGVIVGRALYEGSLDLGEAMEMVRGKRP